MTTVGAGSARVLASSPDARLLAVFGRRGSDSSLLKAKDRDVLDDPAAPKGERNLRMLKSVPERTACYGAAAGGV